MSDIEDEDSSVCPLCVEEMDLSDKNFLPCPCGYRVCMWCWHHIRENLNNLCPACRTPYNSDPHAFSAVDRQEIVKKNRERKQREKLDKKILEKPSTVAKAGATLDRKYLHNFRVVQRNLVYVIGLPLSMSSEDLLRRADYFGQYGKIVKVVVHRNQTISQTTVSAYVTFSFKEDAKAAIHSLDNFILDGHQLRASFGTTKYCNNFIRNVPCNNPDCVYLHELGDEDDRFTKEEIQAGHTKLIPTPGKDQSIVTGCGGPSGTGKRPNGDPILPPPVFIQDNPPSTNSVSKVSTRAPTQGTSTQGSDIKESDELASNSIKLQVLTSNINEKSVSKIESNFVVADVKPVESEKNLRLETKNVAPAPSLLSEEVGESQNVEQDSDNVIVLLGPESTGAFNGVTWNAVFPVPTSSLSSPIWSAILRVSHSNLQTNPFHQSRLTVADILELTLPPIDAAAISPWPKPQGYYLNSMQLVDAKQTESQNSGIINGDAGEQNRATNSFTALRQLFPGVNLSYGSNNFANVANR